MCGEEKQRETYSMLSVVRLFGSLDLLSREEESRLDLPVDSSFIITMATALSAVYIAATRYRGHRCGRSDDRVSLY